MSLLEKSPSFYKEPIVFRALWQKRLWQHVVGLLVGYVSFEKETISFKPEPIFWRALLQKRLQF